MEAFLKKESVSLAVCGLNQREECPIANEFTLPDYCSDIAVVLKCFAYPRVQNRQWSNDKLLIDGSAVIRVLYLDAERRSVRSAEFTAPFACSLRCDGDAERLSAEIGMHTKYVNCRVLTPRRIEVRGAIEVCAYAERVERKELYKPDLCDGLFTKSSITTTSLPCDLVEKIVTVSDTLEFDHHLPPAHMLLGGECRAVVQECKALSGKLIVKGSIYIHQLYTDSADGERTHCLDFRLPYSQILDVPEAGEGCPYRAAVQVISDTERCIIGPDGENTMLDVTAKLLLQVRAYCNAEIPLLHDAYHCRYPLSMSTEELKLQAFLGQRMEEMVANRSIVLPIDTVSEMVDVLLIVQEESAECQRDTIKVVGKLLACVLAKDSDGEIVYSEQMIDYAQVYPCRADCVDVNATVVDYKYHLVDNRLELQVILHITLNEYRCENHTIVSEVQVNKQSAYPQSKISAMLYYAMPGDSVWDIGRACHTSPDTICEENGLQEEEISEETVLIVPLMN